MAALRSRASRLVLTTYRAAQSQSHATVAQHIFPCARYASSSAAVNADEHGASADAGGEAVSAAARAPGPTFTSLGLPSHLTGKLPGLKLSKPTPIQVAALEYLCGELSRPPGDAIVHSETGSGKTLAYLLPLFARIEPKVAPYARLRAIVVTPTRELSLQVAEVAESLAGVGKHKDASRSVRVLRCVGEVSGQTLHALKETPPHILIGTPATLAKLVPAHVNLGELQALVLDEADELMRSHSIAAVSHLASAAAKHGNRPGMIAVSATTSFGLQKFAAEYMRKSVRTLDLTGGALRTPGTLQHYLHRLPSAPAGFNAFTRLLAALRPKAVLSFHNSATSMEALEAHLRSKQIRVAVLGNAYSNKLRAASLGAIASGEATVLLSTEMAARGLDIPRLSHVVNFDLPHTAREYVHRAGRAGRLSSRTPGRTGVVVNFVSTDAEEAALVDTCSILGVGLDDMRFEAGQAVTAPLLAAAPAGRGGHRATPRASPTTAAATTAAPAAAPGSTKVAPVLSASASA